MQTLPVSLLLLLYHSVRVIVSRLAIVQSCEMCPGIMAMDKGKTRVNQLASQPASQRASKGVVEAIEGASQG